MSGTSLGLDMTIVSKAIQSSLAANTWTGYSVAWEKWLHFNMMYGFDPISQSEHTVLAFLCSLMQQNLSHSQVVKTLAGISFFFKLRKFPACSSYFSIRQALQESKKACFVADDRRPISIRLLKKILLIYLVFFSYYEALLFKTAFVVAFFAALRIS